MTYTISIIALSGSACRSWIIPIVTFNPGCYLSKLFQTVALLHSTSTNTGYYYSSLWYNLSQWVVEEIHSAAWWHGLYNSTASPSSFSFVPIVWVRRVMADLGPGQSLNRGWLLQGSTPSDAKAAWGPTGSQQHLNMETSCLFTVKQLIKSSEPGFVWQKMLSEHLDFFV